MNNEHFELRPIVDLKDHHFFIPDYQRGYKWDVQQVLDLLEDIEEFDNTTALFYCLQPLAVKKRVAAKDYEVIDGQQRLTTVHIILSIIDNGIYTLDYKTRPHSKLLLENIKANFDAFEVIFQDNNEKFQEAINDKWSEFIDAKKAEIVGTNHKIEDFNNIDFYHIFMAFLTVKSWFAAKKTDKTTFKNKLLNQTKFIWYNETYEQEPKKVFRNLNSGKVALTNAELIKALFVNGLKDANKEIQQLKQTTLATEWDNIETTLQDGDFWYFINNTKADNYQTRIDYLFELQKGKNAKDNLYTYHKYAEIAKQNNGRLPIKEWKIIKDLFLKLKEWYEDEALYHLIGYLTAKWNKIPHLMSIKEVITLSDKELKSQFKTTLIKNIREKVFQQKNEDGEIIQLTDLAYGDRNIDIHRVLLLFNIETYRTNKQNFRFPFDSFKQLPWSLEHIHAQQSDKVETIGELKQWMSEDDMTKMVEAAKNELDKKIFKALTQNIETLKDTYKEQKPDEKVSDEQRQLLSSIEEQLEMHRLWNMALLDRYTNSGLGKKPFKEKRKEIIEKVQNGNRFIPICTQNAFLKVYTENIQQLDYWSYTDRTKYTENIKKVLKNYLPKPSKTND